MLCPCALKYFEKELNVLKLDDYGITPMETFTDKITYITLKNNHTWGCSYYVLDAGLQGNIDELPNWYTR